MKKILLILVFIFMSVLIGFAQDKTGRTVQGQPDELHRYEEDLWKKIDPRAEWGQWMREVFKPYWDQMQQESAIPEFDRSISGLSAEEFSKKYTEFYHKLESDRLHEIQRSIPPEDLKKYHELVLKFFAAVINLPADSRIVDIESKPEIKQILDQAQQELKRVFEQHKVPSNIISEFLYFKSNEKREN